MLRDGKWASGWTIGDIPHVEENISNVGEGRELVRDPTYLAGTGDMGGER